MSREADPILEADVSTIIIVIRECCLLLLFNKAVSNSNAL